MKKYLAAAVFFAVFVSSAFAADVLDIGTSARSIGMGRTYVGIKNVGECVFGNPAGLYGLKRVELVSMYTELSGDVKYTLLGVAWPTNYGKFGVGYASNKIGDIFATTMDATTGRVSTLEPFSYGTDMLVLDYSNKINKNLDYGLRFKYIRKGSTYATVGEGTGMNLDLSMLYKINDDADAGIVIANAISGGVGAIKWSNGFEEDLPLVVDIGGSYRINKAQIYSDLSLRKTMPPELRLGAEYNVWKSLDLRAGVEQRNASPTEKYINFSAGVGYRFDSFRADYAYYYDSLLTYNSRHYISIAFSLPEGKGRYSEEPVLVEVGNRITTTNETIVLAGRVNRSVTKVRCSNKTADVNDGWFEIPVTLKPGKNKVIVTGFNDYGAVIGSGEARVLRFRWYKDLNKYRWASDSIKYLTTLGIQGSILRDASSTYLRPGESVSRLEISAILARAKNLPTKKLSKPIAKDVSTLHWGSSYMQDAITNGWLNTYPDGTFRPTRKINRAEGITIVSRFAGIAPSVSIAEAPYADVPLNYWGAKPIDAAKKAGLLEYIRGNKFVPGGNLTRAELFDLLAKTTYIKEKVKYLLDFDKGY